MLDRLRIVLVNSTHPGNIGAVARAIKNMGFKSLYLVTPKAKDFLTNQEAIARAAGAGDILATAIITDSLTDAIKDCALVMGLSARSRKIAWPTLEAREAAEKIASECILKAESGIALIFGQEQSGLSTEDLAKCHYQVTISADPLYASLNLAQAVQIVTYECRKAIMALQDQKDLKNTEMAENSLQNEATASIEELEHFYNRLERTLVQIEFLDPKKPRHLMKRLRRLYSKARVNKTELDILQGMLAAIDKKKHLYHEHYNEYH